MKIYTKTGDRGETSLIGGQRVSKSDPRLESYGTVDELNSFLGVLAGHLRESSEQKSSLQFVIRTQHRLFNLGSHLACVDAEARKQLPAFLPEWAEEIESQIDRLDSELPELKTFILPGGSSAASWAHVCRTVTRRAERKLSALQDVALQNAGATLYLNRLSDYFFVLARWCNLKTGVADSTWDKTHS